MSVADFTRATLGTEVCEHAFELFEAGHFVAAHAAWTAGARELATWIETARDTLDVARDEAALREAEAGIARAREHIRALDPAVLREQARTLVTELAKAYRPHTEAKERLRIIAALAVIEGLDPEIDPACKVVAAWYRREVAVLEEISRAVPESFVAAREAAYAHQALANARELATWMEQARASLRLTPARDPRARWIDLFEREELGGKSACLTSSIAAELSRSNFSEARALIAALAAAAPNDPHLPRLSAVLAAREALTGLGPQSAALEALGAAMADFVDRDAPESLWLSEDQRSGVAELFQWRAAVLLAGGREPEALDDLRRAVRTEPELAKTLRSVNELAALCARPGAEPILRKDSSALLRDTEKGEAALARALRGALRHAGDVEKGLAWAERAVAIASAQGSDDWMARALAAHARALAENEDDDGAERVLRRARALIAKGEASPLAVAEVLLARAMLLRRAQDDDAGAAYEEALSAARGCGTHSTVLGNIADETSRFLNEIEAEPSAIRAVLEEGIAALDGYTREHPSSGPSDRAYGEACVDLVGLLASRAYLATVLGEDLARRTDLLARSSQAARQARAHGFFFSSTFASTLVNLALQVEDAAGNDDERRAATDLFDGLGWSPRRVAEKRFWRALRGMAAALLDAGATRSEIAGLFAAAVAGSVPDGLERSAELQGLSARARAWSGFLTTAALSFGMAGHGLKDLGETLGEIEDLAMTYADDASATE